MSYADPAKKKEAARRCYLARREERIAAAKARVLALRQSEEGREQLRTYKRTYRAGLVSSGMTTNGGPRKLWPLPEQRARLRQLVRRLRLWRRQPEIRGALCIAAGRPWTDPRLSGADKWVTQYWADPAFRASEIRRAQQTKAVRRRQERELFDGLTYEEAVRLRQAAQHCAYCGGRLTRRTVTLDHVVPLSRGGRHGTTNVVVACRSCNSSKGARTVAEWRDDEDAEDFLGSSVASTVTGNSNPVVSLALEGP